MSFVGAVTAPLQRAATRVASVGLDTGEPPNASAVLVAPLVVVLLVGLRSPAHRWPCAIALVLGVEVLTILRRRATSTSAASRFRAEMLAYGSVGAWLAIALWSVLDHHR